MEVVDFEVTFSEAAIASDTTFDSFNSIFNFRNVVHSLLTCFVYIMFEFVAAKKGGKIQTVSFDYGRF
jgi:hypothetical protein